MTDTTSNFRFRSQARGRSHCSQLRASGRSESRYGTVQSISHFTSIYVYNSHTNGESRCSSMTSTKMRGQSCWSLFSFELGPIISSEIDLFTCTPHSLNHGKYVLFPQSWRVRSNPSIPSFFSFLFFSLIISSLIFSSLIIEEVTTQHGRTRQVFLVL